MKKILTLFFMVILSQAYSQIDLENGLVAFYPFCGDASDHSNNNNDGIAEGVEFVADPAEISNNACLFNGTDTSYIYIPSSTSLENIEEQLSISLWFNTEILNIPENFKAPLLCKSEILAPNPPTRQISLFYDIAGVLYFNDEEIITYSFELNVWYNLVVTYSDSILTCYINGILEGDAESVGIQSNQSQLDIGRDSTYYEFYNGTMDDIRIYNRVLTMDEITFLSTDNHDCSTTSTEDLNPLENISITPNPFHDVLKIHLPNTFSEEIVIRIHDSKGKQIANNEYKFMEEIVLSTSDFNPGIYFISIITDEWERTEKIIKAKR